MAVIYRTECRGTSIRTGRMLQGIVLLLVVAGAAANPQPGCDQARKDLEAGGLPTTWLQERPSHGETCGDNSCCSAKAEQEMFIESKRQVGAFLRDSISKVSSVIDVRARKFDVLFRDLMNKSKIEFHEMFHKTYGKIYLQNSDVFSDFFNELESYYKKGATRLSDTLENFFVVLYQRMFTVINSQYTFDDKYLMCVSEHMKDVQPFGDIPHKFTQQLKRSFVATRTYYKALATAAEAAKRLLNVRVDKECEKELVNMRYCGSCNGLRGMGTCSNYCTAVLQACLRHHTAFSSEWDNFIGALDKVADRLVGPYNIESVVEPLNIKVSEAIMSFQDSGTEVSKRIFGLCGEPTLSRKRRKAVGDDDDVDDNPSYEIKSTPMREIGHKKKKKNKKYQEEELGPSLERLIKEIKTKVHDTRQFWEHLPYQYCNNISAPLSSRGNCWNGTHAGEFLNGTVKQPSSPISPLVNEQIYLLQTYTDKLRKAFQGDEVEIIDDSEDSLDGSGSGSGDFEIVDESEEREVVPRKDDDFSVNEIPEERPPPTTKEPTVIRTHSGGASTMPLSKALVQYLLPIVLVWFGGAISDLL